MNHQDLLVRTQRRGHLHGPGETRRVIRGVLTGVSDILPAPAFRRLVTPLPPDLRVHHTRSAVDSVRLEAAGCRAFLDALAGRLLTDEANAAFLARVVFEQLNDSGLRTTPAALAWLVPVDLRALFCAWAPERPGSRAPLVRTLTFASRPARSVRS